MSEVMKTARDKEREYAEMLRRELDYEPHSGRLRWRDGSEGPWKTYRSSKGAEVMIGGMKLSAARIVWMWHHGRMPPHRLRHQNGSAFDTRIQNLGFYDKANGVKGAGFRWGVCVPDKWGPYPVAFFDTYDQALSNCESVRAAYMAACPVRRDKHGVPKWTNIPSPWDRQTFSAGEWEARDLV